MANVKAFINPAYPPGRVVNTGVRPNLKLPFRTDTTRAVVKAPIAAVVSAFPSDPNFNTAAGLSIATRRSSGDDWRINSANLQGAPGPIADALRTQRDQLALEQYTDKYFDVARDNVGPIGRTSSYPTYAQVKLDRDVQYAYPDAQASLNYYPDKLMYRGAALGVPPTAEEWNSSDKQYTLPKDQPKALAFIPPEAYIALYALYTTLKPGEPPGPTANWAQMIAYNISQLGQRMIDAYYSKYINLLVNPDVKPEAKQKYVDDFAASVERWLGTSYKGKIVPLVPCYAFGPAGRERCTTTTCTRSFCDAQGNDTNKGPKQTLDTSTAPVAKDNTMLYIALGVGAVAILGGVFLMTRKK